MIVPTGGDIDASLRSLRIEFNDLDKQTTTTQIDRGKRLIAIRQLLELKNGRLPNPRYAGPDGLAPIGWTEWLRENMTVSRGHAMKCVRHAVNPEGRTILDRTANKKYRAAPLSGFQLRWARYTDETKRQIAEFVIAEVQKEQR